MGNALQNDPQNLNNPNQKLNNSPDALVKMLGNTFLTNDGSGDKTFRDGIAPNKIIGLYFSAHWCPPCRQFTPFLKELHKEWKKLNYSIEIVFISSDKTYEQFKEYFNNEHGNWLALPFGNNLGRSLSQQFQISGIPSLVFIDGYGNIIEREGRQLVGQQRSNSYNTLIAKMPKVDAFHAFQGTGHSLKNEGSNNNNNNNNGNGEGVKTLYDEVEGKDIMVDKQGGKKTCKIQVVLVGGKRETIEINVEDKVRNLYGYVKKLNDCGRFELLAGFPPKRLDNGDDSIETAGLVGSRITQKKV